ncbi:Protein of unknown function [Rhodococcus rhodochrous J3]|uniref:DUF742 domain-containing protein n=1 Tax=Rhodococcus rhodochrous J3 TaxID=903528 RepID=A0ABY1M553_RHORH|nr:DUF742 domain-containing protein [Rhodococcus rhodochrous]AYA26200.1 DUF742 domain-containing protein [Rhodococcus rhodochrous]MBF4481693.1 DUF742 domain-containing protein [Rhodococcus rhodochrous]MCB8911866.1 DUF742 domain-containing protein [Rhodococcus rhodochrous]SMG09644.1 Protein of unknown function [Rhodococcus rhodochrous J3]
MSVADSEWPVVGATGARFGSGGSRRRRRPADHAVPVRNHREPGPVVDEVTAAEEYRSAAQPVDAARSVDTAQAVGRNAGTGTSVGIEDMNQPETSSFVRPFVRSGGRTRAEVELPLEVLVSAVPSAMGSESGPAMDEHRLVLALCAQPRSIMEIAALAQIPLGVARVLVGDLAATGEITVHRTADKVGPNVELLERVLTGLNHL